jgi:type IV pilus assembly protein PilW
MLKLQPGNGSRPCQRGLSLVELLVGVAIGLLIVAGAATVVATQLVDSRKLVLEAQVQQDLRATSDIITRQLRRAGYWTSAVSSISTPGSTVALNPSVAINLDANSACPTDVTITLSNSSVTGFRLVAGPPGYIVQKFGANPAQELTDKGTISIELFCVKPAPVTTVQGVRMSCPALCADGTQNCWPTLQPQELLITITGRSITDPNVVRTIQSAVRIRNDQILNQNPVGSLSGPLCPA